MKPRVRSPTSRLPVLQPVRVGPAGAGVVPQVPHEAGARRRVRGGPGPQRAAIQRPDDCAGRHAVLVDTTRRIVTDISVPSPLAVYAIE